jgi:hypothetical protein
MGVSPLGSLRTVLELLDSHGSHCPAVGPHAQSPMGKQLRFASCDAHQPPLGPPGVAVHRLYFLLAHRTRYSFMHLSSGYNLDLKKRR